MKTYLSVNGTIDFMHGLMPCQLSDYMWDNSQQGVHALCGGKPL